jgi:AsmA protein
MKTLKATGLVVAGLIGFAILAAVALLLLVDPNRHRDAIEAKVREVTGRPFAISGAIKIKFFPWLALDVGMVSIGNPEGFGAAPLLSVERARVGARLLPLLHGELDVSRIALDGLTLDLVRHADGHSNWESQGERPPASRPAGGRRLSRASVAGVDLTRATLTLRDEAAQSLFRLRDVEFHSGALGPALPSDLEFRARLDSGDGTPATRVELHTRATLDTGRSLATLTKVTLSGERNAADGKSMPFAVNSPQIALDWNVGTLAPATLDVRLGALALSAELAGEQLLSGTRHFQCRVRIAEQSLRALAPSFGWSVPATRDPNAFSHFATTASVRLSGRALMVEDLELMLDHSHVRGRVAVPDVDAPALDVELHADTVDLDAYRAAAAPAATTAKPAAASPLPVAALRALNARGSVALDHARVAGLTLSDLHVPFSAHGGELRLAPSARAFGGTIAGEIRLDASHEPVTLIVTEDIRGIDIGAAVKAYAGSDRLSGLATATARLSGSGATDTALIGSLAGPIAVDVKDGAVEGLDVSYEIERAQALVQGQAPPARTGPARTPFKVLTGQSRLDHGVLATDPLRLETQTLKASGKGTFRLADQAVDYRLAVILQEAPPGLASLRGVEIPLTVTGTVHDYKVRPDLGGVVKGRVKQEIEKRKGELGEKLKDVLKDLIPH